MRTYPSAIVGLPYEGRAANVGKHVKIGHRLDLRREEHNPADFLALAAYHETRTLLGGKAWKKIGYIPRRHRWIIESMADGNDHEVIVTGFAYDDDGAMTAVKVDVTVLRPEREITPEEAAGLAEMQAIMEIEDEIRLLVLVAAADGRFQKAERAIVEKYVAVRMADRGCPVSDPALVAAVKRARRRPPEDAEIAEMVHRIADSDPDGIEAIWQVTEIVAEIDGKVKGEEAEAVERIRLRISAARELRR